MCCFSRPVRQVSRTRIFARREGDQQALVYRMHLHADAELSMLLPIPARGGERAVRFVDLSGYDEFFDHLARCFPEPLPPASLLFGITAGGPRAPLEVHQVGSFESSFVPTLADFDRLDPRFRLPPDVWRQFPLYDDFGFVVFQLRPGKADLHPMAFWFTTREPTRLFFPTTHVHDGQVHPTAPFDHELYAQAEGDADGWDTGPVLPRDTMDFCNPFSPGRVRGLVEPERPMRRRRLHGELPNQDTWLSG